MPTQRTQSIRPFPESTPARPSYRSRTVTTWSGAGILARARISTCFTWRVLIFPHSRPAPRLFISFRGSRLILKLSRGARRVHGDVSMIAGRALVWAMVIMYFQVLSGINQLAIIMASGRWIGYGSWQKLYMLTRSQFLVWISRLLKQYILWASMNFIALYFKEELTPLREHMKHVFNNDGRLFFFLVYNWAIKISSHHCNEWKANDDVHRIFSVPRLWQGLLHKPI